LTDFHCPKSYTPHSNTSPLAAGILYLESEGALFLKAKSLHQGYARPVVDSEIDPHLSLQEGRKALHPLAKYERNPKLRALCLKHYGFHCAVCNFSFGARYGATGEGYIHVHHLTPLSQIAQAHEVDPVKDLRPVCPNCHAMLHTRTPPLSIEELKAALK
jgi:predicted HNH restriction endonuclease